jgi:hypothetical protein
MAVIERVVLMRSFVGCLAKFCLALSCILGCAAQTRDGLQGSTFRSPAIGMTYSVPSRFSAKIGTNLPQDPSGREHIILTVWETSDGVGIPRMTFLYDTKVRPVGSTRETMAARYLAAMKDVATKGGGVSVSVPKAISPAGYVIWRMNYIYPAAPERAHNCGIVIPLKDRRILAIQINASSEADLDAEVDSLRELHFDANTRP